MPQKKITKKRPNGAGGVREYVLSDGSSRWEIYFSEDDAQGDLRRRFKKGFVTELAAMQELQAIQVHQREGRHQRTVKESFGQFAEAYLAGLRVKPTTLAGYRRYFRVHIQPALGSMKLSSITRNDLDRLYRAMESSGRRDAYGLGKPSSPASVRHVHALIKQILKSAVDDGLIMRNPADRANPPSASQARAPEIKTWDASESIRFLNRARTNGDYLYLAWQLLLGSGMRRGELVALRWQDVDLANGQIAIRRSYYYIKQMGEAPLKGFGSPKNGRTRVVDIDPRLVAELRAHKDQATAARVAISGDSLVLPNRKGEPLNPERLTQQFRARVLAARDDHPDLTLITLHGLRHTHATLLLSGGIHPKVVQERLGHSNIMITLNTYSHVLPTLQRGAATTIGDMLSAQEATETDMMSVV